jgi:hypothetical protein
MHDDFSYVFLSISLNFKLLYLNCCNKIRCATYEAGRAGFWIGRTAFLVAH